MLLKGKWKWEMGNGEWGMGVSGNTKKLSWSLRRRQRDKDCTW